MSVNEYKLPFRTKFNRLWLTFGIRSVFRIFGRVKMTGLNNVPMGTSYVIAMNHVSIFDPPFVVCFWPEKPEVIGAANMFKKKGEGNIMSLYGTIPVHRGEYDRTLLDKIVAVLRQGRPLVIAPEGGRSHVVAMQRAMPGLGYIIEHAQVPVIPVGILGTTGDFWQKAKRGKKPSIEMRIGKPIHFAPISEKGAERREARQRNADMVMRYIAGLLPSEYHGVYAGQAISTG